MAAPAAGAHDAVPDHLVAWGVDKPPPRPYPPGAYGASDLAPSALDLVIPLFKP